MGGGGVKEEWLDAFMDWSFRWVMGPLMVVCILFIAVVAVCGAADGANRLVRGTCEPTIPLVAESVRHTPEGTSLVMVGKVLTRIHHPEKSWASVAGAYSRTGGACIAKIDLTRQQFLELSGGVNP